MFLKHLVQIAVEFYNPEENSWHFLPELAFGVFSCAAAMYKQNLYISGGISSDPEDNVPVNYLMAYIAGNRTWAPLAPMLTPRQGHAMVGALQVFVFFQVKFSLYN